MSLILFCGCAISDETLTRRAETLMPLRRISILWLSRSPRQLLLEYTHLLPSTGLALDAAAGVGASSSFLAEKGLKVIALDISLVALRQAKQRASARLFPIEAVVYNLSNPWLPPNTFDVILNFHFLERATFPVFRQALKPAGLLFFETFQKSEDDLIVPEYYLEPGELLAAFEDYDIMYWGENVLPATETHPQRAMAQLVARKPIYTTE
jgi:2-polyprenyl-3-methyl-5-hydroxy-6-metoxy-1,4-benzoquinol methylase